MVVVDGLDEWLDLASLLDLLGAHSSGDLGWVSLDADNESVGEWVSLGASVIWLNYDDLLILNRDIRQFVHALSYHHVLFAQNQNVLLFFFMYLALSLGK